MRLGAWKTGVTVGVAVAAALVLPGAVIRQPAPTPTTALVGDAVWAPRAVLAPDFALRDQDGKLIALRSLRGRVVALTFMDSLCTTECPIEGAVLATVQRQLGRSTPLVVVVVSTDATGDTPARVRAFARRYGWTGPWYWLLGSQQQLAPVWGAYSITVVSVDGHSDAIYLIGRTGYERAAFGFPYSRRLLVADVQALAMRRTTAWTWPWDL